jgi:hypothetical protein
VRFFTNLASYIQDFLTRFFTSLDSCIFSNLEHMYDGCGGFCTLKENKWILNKIGDFI